MASTFTLPDFHFPTNDDEDYDGEDYEEGEGEDYEEGEDIDAAAEAMAKRLGDQLLADIAKAQAEVAATAVVVSPVLDVQPYEAPSHDHYTPVPQENPSSHTLRQKKDAAILTMKGVLAFASNHSIVGSTLSSSMVPGPGGGNLIEVLTRCVSTSYISKPLARALTEAILSIAKSDALFGVPRTLEASAPQHETGKRKRDETDEGGRYAEASQKRAAFGIPLDQPDLLHQIGEALRIVSETLSRPSASPQSVDPGTITSIQLQLHQIFLFAVTSAPRAGDGRMQALQELAGLVQMLGVLSGIHIGNPPPQWPGTPPSHAASTPDIGTAVYPCLVPGCPKTFHRLYSLRTHQRLHTLEHRPYRCAQCPASFVRNHDLKRHMLLHEKKAWRCAGCNKIFSRRDAIKRHKDARGRAMGFGGGGKGRAGEADAVDTACAFAEIEEVEVDKADGEEEISRRAKLWNGIAASGNTIAEHIGPEEGEVDPAIIHQAQNMVLGIHGLLQAEVTKGLGAPSAPAPGPMPAPHISQSTLASIIARAQQSAAPTETSATASPAAADQPLATGECMDFTAAASEPVLGPSESPAPPPLSLSWLSEEQTRLLEQAIAQASSAAQAQAEAEAALEEEGEEYDDEEGEGEYEGEGE